VAVPRWQNSLAFLHTAHDWTDGRCAAAAVAVAQNLQRGASLAGVVAFVGVATLASNNRPAIPWPTVAWYALLFSCLHTRAWSVLMPRLCVVCVSFVCVACRVCRQGTRAAAGAGRGDPLHGGRLPGVPMAG
jgi:hypothetical protein